MGLAGTQAALTVPGASSSSKLPGPQTRAVLERGIPLYRNGPKFEEQVDRAGRRFARVK